MDPEPRIFLFLSNIDWPVVLSILTLVALLFSSAIISGSEVAFFSLSKTDLSEEKTKKGNMKLVAELLSNPAKLLATILISNNFINILFVLIFAFTGDHFFGSIGNPILKFFLEIILVTFLLLLFGEVLPKIYASRNAAHFAALMARPIKILNSFFTFLSFPLINLTSFLEQRLTKKNSEFNVEVLSQAFELTSKTATTKEEKKILQGIVTFGNTETSEVMCPRMDIFALTIEEEFLDVMKKIIDNGHSRIPVYEDNIDNIVGVLYIKDLIPHLNKKTFKWQKLLRKPFFVPENKKLDDLLREFQEMKNHLAIVVDEYGGTCGIITLEDIIEEIVGDISDEFDEQDAQYTKIDSQNYLFEGRVSLKDFFKITKINPDVFESYMEDAETIAGLILEVTGRYPKRKEKISIGPYVISIESLDLKRIKQVKITLPDAPKSV